MSFIIGIIKSTPSGIRDHKILKNYTTQLICQQQFINSLCKESNLIYKGQVAYKDKAGIFRNKQNIDFKGVVFPQNLEAVVSKIKEVVAKGDRGFGSKIDGSAAKRQQTVEGEKRVEIKMAVEHQSEYFSYKKTIKQIRFTLPASSGTTPLKRNKIEEETKYLIRH
jgi:hypothetical protein